MVIGNKIFFSTKNAAYFFFLFHSYDKRLLVSDRTWIEAVKISLAYKVFLLASSKARCRNINCLFHCKVQNCDEIFQHSAKPFNRFHSYLIFNCTMMYSFSMKSIISPFCSYCFRGFKAKLYYLGKFRMF